MSKVTTNKYLLLFVILISGQSLFAQEWLTKIIPTQTTLSEVKKITGADFKKERDDQVLFQLKEGNLFIGLSLGQCVKTTWGSWNVEKDVILYVIFYPKKDKKTVYYNLENKGLEQGNDSGHITYRNNEIGLYYSTQFGKVSGINLYPSSRYNDLRCKNF